MTSVEKGQPRKKGSLILTEGRSGSSWLGSLTSGTGELGHSYEWFTRRAFPKELKSASMDDYITTIIEKASTPNGYFYAKIFPGHMHFFNIAFGEDLIAVLMAKYDCNFVSLYRRDRLRQAISFARGVQTKQWTSGAAARKEAQYDPDLIARCFFVINRSYDYWESYTSIRNLKVTKFVYEDLVGKPQAFLDAIAEHAGISVDTIPETNLKIQRDDITEQWVEQFQNDLPNLNVVANSTPHRPFKRNPTNMRRFLTGKAMKPYPYSY